MLTQRAIVSLSLRLSLLNTTVSQMAKSVSQVLTMCYRDMYGEESDADEPMTLSLLTAPLAATEEVVALYTAGLAPCEIAMPAVLHAIGASKDEIEKAVEKMCNQEEKAAAIADEDRERQKADSALSTKERESSLADGKERQKVELDQARANVAQTKKQTGEIGKTPPGGASSGSPGSGGGSGAEK